MTAASGAGYFSGLWWHVGEGGTEVDRGVKLLDPDTVLPPVSAAEGPGAGPEPVPGPDPGRPDEGDDEPLDPAPVEPPAFSPPEFWAEYAVREALERGEVVTQAETEGNTATSRAECLVAAPPDRVWQAITDYENYPEFMPDTVACTVVKHEGLEFQLHQEIEVAWRRVRYDLLVTHREDRLGTSWHKVSGDLDVNDGSWSIVQVEPEKCLAIYRLRVMPNFWIPQSIADRLIRRSLPGVVRAVKKRAEGG
ncbi:MAG: SRPBCC family protein [Planctomycetes bacterium]|nr:SRPBCC family protein [Planctomycetota bacterium]